MMRTENADSNSNSLPPLKEYADHYEYRLIEDYEQRYSSFEIQSIQLEEVLVNLLATKDETVLVSLLFLKPAEREAIRDWLSLYTVSYDQHDGEGYFIEGADELLDVMLYKGKPIAVATRGEDRLYYDIAGAVEVRRPANFPKQKKPLLYLNGEARYTVPRIGFDPLRDEVHVNGLFLFIDYMDNFGGQVGFFRKTDPKLPVVLLIGKSIIGMGLTAWADGRRILIVEQPYESA